MCPLWLGPFTGHICALPGDSGLGRQAGCSLLSLGSIPMYVLPRRYLCCETQTELREWFATFLFVQVPGGGWGPRRLPSWRMGMFISSP